MDGNARLIATSAIQAGLFAGRERSSRTRAAARRSGSAPRGAVPRSIRPDGGGSETRTQRADRSVQTRLAHAPPTGEFHGGRRPVIEFSNAAIPLRLQPGM